LYDFVLFLELGRPILESHRNRLSEPRPNSAPIVPDVGAPVCDRDGQPEGADCKCEQLSLLNVTCQYATQKVNLHCQRIMAASCLYASQRQLDGHIFW